MIKKALFFCEARIQSIQLCPLQVIMEEKERYFAVIKCWEQILLILLCACISTEKKTEKEEVCMLLTLLIFLRRLFNMLTLSVQ